jgi:AcrR family transcriptional regulator
VCWQRARRPEQIQARRDAILASAATLFADHDYDDVSLAAIADGAGLAKSNLYRYFECKEAIFLELYLHDVTDFSRRATKAMAACGDCDEPARVATALAREAVVNPRMLRLQSRLSLVLERRASAEAITAFKRELDGVTRALTEAMAAALPSLDAESASFALLVLHAYTAGLWPAAHPGPELDEALHAPDLSHYRIEFASTLERTLAALLTGLMHESPSEESTPHPEELQESPHP